MKINSITSALVGLAMASYAAAMPAVGDKIDASSLPSTLSDAVRADLAQRDPSTYTLYERTDSDSSDLEKRAQVNGLITRCSTSRCMSITFDDGPYTSHKNLVDQFDAAGSKATFFVNGNNFRCIYDKDSVSALRYSYSRGHQICSHTWDHPDISTLNNQQLDEQVQLVEDALWKIIGAVPSCIRAPYGNIRDDQVAYLNNRWGLQVIGWNADTGDANGDGVDAALNVYRGLKAPKHAIVLNHETVSTTPSVVIPQALKIIKQNGYSGSQTVAATTRFNPYKVVGSYGKRDASWTCDGKPGPGQA
ncbi:uncharacterized protein PFL1_00107 [Pseudozyma flocculosa PF-1]|uniref:Related to deacetylase n=1 Tax=Pseudozyma flocculosa TaxID=84751 RepID=A0A5C3ETL9_9BASI|nr:uncharacterized protein PFL1_00107 [Pseudozyma flocculosa PF-1]EPQ31908.1 hypothetical protein PFL1_00107 [Pseudozyma flocculosa PF-1]SPO35180.1 related to deacetylase [Pseudozyma flocculosa]